MSRVKLLFQLGSGICQVEARIGSRLANVIRKEGYANSDFAECKYKLECGKCAISNKDGVLGYPSIEEERLLTSKGFFNNFRCACQVIVNEDMESKVIKLS